ncbi:hypothetical protein NQZ68_009265 [Dissostichus eleginoides]|nr:hypothetical protein NQZ68_009265 [Dissostichus eleginoides]
MTTNVSALSGARQQGPPANISGAEPAASAMGPHWVPTVPGPGSPAPTAPPEAPPLAEFTLRLLSSRQQERDSLDVQYFINNGLRDKECSCRKKWGLESWSSAQSYQCMLVHGHECRSEG